MSNASRAITVTQIGKLMLDTLEHWSAEDQLYADGWVDETTWSRRLTSLLNQRGIAAVHQKPYPGSRKTCDVVTELQGDAELWIEIKGAWLITRPFVHQDGRRIGGGGKPTYRKHLFHESESALKDIAQKLPMISGANKDLAFLLIGFDSSDLGMDGEIEELTRLGKLDDGWALISKAWHNPKDERYRIRCWFWHRPAAETPPDVD